jgi:hypothetical protein
MYGGSLFGSKISFFRSTARTVAITSLKERRSATEDLIVTLIARAQWVSFPMAITDAVSS